MAKGYWIVHVDIIDPEKFKVYASATPVALKKYGAQFLARAGQYENPEGATKTRNSIIEFPSYQAAIDCYYSEEYQAAAKLRLSAVTIDVVIVEGVDAS